MKSFDELQKELPNVSEDALQELEACLMTYGEYDDLQGKDDASEESIDSAHIPTLVVERYTDHRDYLSSVEAIVKFRMVPRGVHHEREIFVKASLNISISSIYPEEACRVVGLEDVYGMEEEEQGALMETLQDEANAMRGELALGHLFEIALDYVTDVNFPKGICSFCLEGFDDQQGSDSMCSPLSSGCSTDIAVRLPCYHTFHSTCFTSWFFWQQTEYDRLSNQIIADFGAVASGKMREYGLKCEKVSLWSPNAPEMDVWAVKCPHCRYAISPKQLIKAIPRSICEAFASSKMQLKKENGCDDKETKVPIIVSTDWMQPDGRCNLNKTALTKESLENIKNLQRCFEKKLKLQKEKGGLVDENVAVSLSQIETSLDARRQASGSLADARNTSNQGRDNSTRHARSRNNYRGKHWKRKPSMKTEMRNIE